MAKIPGKTPRASVKKKVTKKRPGVKKVKKKTPERRDKHDAGRTKEEAAPSEAEGIVKVVSGVQDIANFQKGNILVSEMTEPSMVNVIKALHTPAGHSLLSMCAPYSSRK